MVRVLICDDAVAFATLVRHWLSRCDDIEVVGVAGSGAQALALADSLAPDVIILDHLLYDVPNGSEELGPQLREMLPDLGIVLVSGMAEDDLAEIAERWGADAYMSKATRPEIVCDAVRAASRRIGGLTTAGA